MSSFKHCVINYIRIEEFGIEIDYKSCLAAPVEVEDPAAVHDEKAKDEPAAVSTTTMYGNR